MSKKLTSNTDDPLMYMSLVKNIAGQIHRTLPHNTYSIDELIQAGAVGLLESWNRYDASKGVCFQDYARYRIRGEIMDFLRSLDMAPRSVRKNQRIILEKEDNLTQNFLRQPTEEELFKETGLSAQEFQTVVNFPTLISLDSSYQKKEDGMMPLRETIASPYTSPEEILEQHNFINFLYSALERLSPREQAIFRLYNEGKTLREIGELYNITEGRVCQIRTKAINRLRTEFSRTSNGMAIAEKENIEIREDCMEEHKPKELQEQKSDTARVPQQRGVRFREFIELLKNSAEVNTDGKLIVTNPSSILKQHAGFTYSTITWLQKKGVLECLNPEQKKGRVYLLHEDHVSQVQEKSSAISHSSKTSVVSARVSETVSAETYELEQHIKNAQLQAQVAVWKILARLLTKVADF
jgi:RNA polymerase sigma factor FliA